ncbi:tol-pal system-associated acyl-CoA thioesterase [Thiohalomonas denitrificans]|uniref:Acyl-CoA thioester hydrolase n=1 Tax=Thiohalomonas denitrificans TaxID=415747 RepID=A0A1G5PKS9_9GAMM|nr:tol-pal system-associated acyl-CoA thioesterase [Thiohalomonas denitrificans]SCZ50113.1 acyl-CoA thioester hydrolase [Thiohalomonas denitrificans]
MSDFVFPVRVYYEDTDAGGVVYYANYLKFMERARTEWLRELGFEQDVLREDEGILFAVRSVRVDYLRPAMFNDQLAVSAEVVGQRGVCLTFRQEVRRGTETLCRGEVTIVSIDACTMKPRRIPRAVMERLSVSD